MANQALTEIACPNCLSPIDVRQHGQHVTCAACSSQFILDGHICASCNHYHREEQAFCSECGVALTRQCQKCNTKNWAGDEFCKQCGVALDIFQLLHLAHNQATTNRLLDQQKWAREIKEKEELDSQVRMVQIMDAERERQAAVATRLQQNRSRDRMIYVGLGLGVLFMMFFCFATLVFL